MAIVTKADVVLGGGSGVLPMGKPTSETVTPNLSYVMKDVNHMTDPFNNTGIQPAVTPVTTSGITAPATVLVNQVTSSGWLKWAFLALIAYAVLKGK